MKLLFKLVFMISALVFGMTTSALAWTPTKTIEIVVPFPPGGATDKLGRMISEIFNRRGWNSVVANRPGADTVIASNYVAEAPADGHTLYLGSNGFIDANLVYGAPGIKYTQDSFTPIVPLGTGSFVLVASNGAPVTNYAEFKEYIRNNPNKFVLGFWNTYTSKIFLEWARREGLPEPNIVIYRGSAPLMVDVIGEHVTFAIDTVTSVRQHYAANKLKVIGTLDPEGVRLVRAINPQAQITDISRLVPTAGINLYYGLFAPAGLDPNIAKAIQDLLNNTFTGSDPTYKNALLEFSIVNPGGNSALLRQRQTYLYNQFAKSVNR
jgi:tripartite-type tricarboxylate transporter receptor subunit TctC